MGRERPLSTNDPNLKTAKSRDDDTIDFVISDETKAHIYGPARVPLKLDWAAVSDIGKLREHNEDHYLVFQRRKDQAVLDTNLPHGSLANSTEDVYVFAVADGLGGHSHGELASAMVLQSGVSGKEGSWLMQLADLDIAEVIPHATAAAEAVHRRLLDEAYRDAKLRGMASTLTAAVVFGHQVVLLHLGDSRAYRFHDGELTQVTRDHTLAQDMARNGLTGQRTSRLANVLTNCLGGDDGQVRVETHELRWSSGDALLLCTDGLTDLVTPAEISAELAGPQPAKAVCQTLLDRALENGGRDNITLIVVRFLN